MPSIVDIQDLAPRVQYTASAAQTVFPYPFPIFEDDNLVVYDNDTLQVLTTDYTVSGAGDETGGSVTFTSGRTAAHVITIYRDIPIERTSDFQTNGPLASASFNDELDRIILVQQQLEAAIGRCLRLSQIANVPSASMELSPLANWLDRFVYIGSTGVPEPATSVTTTTLSQSIIAALLNPQTAAEATASVQPTAKQYDELDVRRYGADPTGVADSTTAFLNAILVAQAKPNGARIRAPVGDYKIISTLTITGNRIHIDGDGPNATRIVFVPSANDTLFEFNAGATSVTRCSLRGLNITSADSTFTKVGVDLFDVSEFDLDDVTIIGTVVVSSTNYWSGANSIGLRARGRESLSVRNVQIQADRPLVLTHNPNSVLDADHFNFHNCYFIANANPVVDVDDGVSLSNVSFTGYQAWVRGTVGFKWVNTVAFGFNPYKLSFENVRTEQGTDNTQYAFDITATSGVIGDVMFRNSYWGSDRKGLRSTRTMRIELDGVTYASSSLEALTVTGVANGAENTQLSMRKCYWQTTSTATLTAMRLLWSLPKGGTTQPLPPDAEYAYDGTVNKNFVTNLALGGEPIPLAAGAVHPIAPTGAIGVLVVGGGDGSVGVFALNGTANDTDELLDGDGLFSGAAGTGSSTNVYWSAGNARYELENNRGAPLSFTLTMLGSYTDF